MSLGSQFRQLEKQAAVFRQELFGTDAADKPATAQYNRGEKTGIEGYYHAVKRRYATQEQGFIEQEGIIWRHSKDKYPWPPEIGKELVLKDATGQDRTYIIEDLLGAHVASVEWVLGCRLVS